ncbi:MAG TPA: VIT1/CCC1 transporter family protein [Syntrophorhabdales bacterium]|nr:VIT1/CCC1 transporter family protein [Syntrophorhabdales bacterium]
MTINTEETPSLLRTFWSSEIISESLYRFLAANYDDPDRKRDIVAIGTMERGHAQVWNKIARDVHGVSFQVSLVIKFKIVLLKLLSLVLPLTIFIHYLEHGEKKAILDYAGLLESYKDNEKARTIITNVILQEIGHQWHMMEQIADKRLYIEKVKEAIPGMTAGIIETLGLVIGLLAAHAKISMIGLTGLIAMIGGMIAEMSVSYISSKGHHDLNEGRDKELTIKKEVNPTLLRRELENDLAGRGISSETVRLILDSIGDDAGVLFSLVKTIRTTAEALHPKESLKTTGMFFIVGAFPVLAPFLIGTMWNSDPTIPAIIAFVLAVISISIAGLFMAVLSGKRIATNIIHNLFIIIGTAALTYLVGLAARLFLGIGR